MTTLLSSIAAADVADVADVAVANEYEDKKQQPVLLQRSIIILVIDQRNRGQRSCPFLELCVRVCVCLVTVTKHDEWSYRVYHVHQQPFLFYTESGIGLA
eukprot:scaffold7696_cov141-Cylindrotheca_fusiformis.AAC.7